MSIGKPILSGLLKLKSSRVVHSCLVLTCGRLGAMSFTESKSNKVRKRAFSTEVPSKPLASTIITAEATNQFIQEEERPVAKMPFSTQDKISIFILVLLYTLQGIPMGLCASIPLILKEKGASYESLSFFSLVSLPFSFKILWAPFVDSIYLKSFGRRKSWTVPVQMLCGAMMVFFGHLVDVWSGTDSPDAVPDVSKLTYFFFLLYFLMATQDIAVDGWALTMLSRESVGYASMCNSIGQIFGVFIANQGFIALSDTRWCHRYLGMAEGTSLVSMSGFMRFWGFVFIATTVFIWAFKSEEPPRQEEKPHTVSETWQQLGSILKLPSVRKLAMIIFTCKIAFAASDAVSGFKLQEYGMPKADIATMSPVLLLVGLLVPAFTSHLVTARPFDSLLVAIPVKLITSACTWVMVMNTKDAYAGDNTPGFSFFAPLMLVMVVHEVASNLAFLSFMTFFSQISDPHIGGSYMTLLNTLMNLASKWPNLLSLWSLPKLTSWGCSKTNAEGIVSILYGLTCHGKAGVDECNAAGGVCEITTDGYSLLTVTCFVVGIIWLFMSRRALLHLQDLPQDDWLVYKRNNGSDGGSSKEETWNDSSSNKKIDDPITGVRMAHALRRHGNNDLDEFH